MIHLIILKDVAVVIADRKSKAPLSVTHPELAAKWHPDNRPALRSIRDTMQIAPTSCPLLCVIAPRLKR